MEISFYSFIFLFGLLVGSFLNVVILRLKSGTTFDGRSKCPKCKKQLFWYDNIPIVSFLILKGKCRFCKKSISVQYPLVELTVGILFSLTVYNILDDGGFFVFAEASLIDIVRIITYLYFISILVVIFVYDLRWYMILDIVTLPAIVISFLLQWYLSDNILHLFLAALIGGGFFLLQFLISQGRWIGGGDIRLGVLMGFMLSYPYIIVALMISYFMGSIFGLSLMAFGKKRFGDKLPFGTFLTLATVITLLYGEPILNWYLYSFLR